MQERPEHEPHGEALLKREGGRRCRGGNFLRKFRASRETKKISPGQFLDGLW